MKIPAAALPVIFAIGVAIGAALSPASAQVVPFDSLPGPVVVASTGGVELRTFEFQGTRCILARRGDGVGLSCDLGRR